MNLGSGGRLPLATMVLAAIPNAVLLAVSSLAVLCLPGCGENSPPREEPPMPVEETVFGDQVEAIRRAEDLATSMEGRNEDLDSRLEEVEGERPDARGE